MDGLLRSEELPKMIDGTAEEAEKLFEKAFHMESGCVLFPVRHHSPACSFHIRKVIEQYKPDTILIEGPENASHLIEFAVSDKTKPPFCIYLSYEDKAGKIGKPNEKYRAYYPFLDYSPELTALREGAKQKIPCRFIDLSYGEKLLNSPKANKEEKESYDDDRTFLQSSYYNKLTEKLGCKSFNELWEMLFEIDGCAMDTKNFVRNLFYYCYYSRKNTPKEELLYHGDNCREYFMAESIRQAMKEYGKVLVVTGGIHTIALAEMIHMQSLPEHTIIKSNAEDCKSYLMPYSYEESDWNHGYESGMVFPFFYQRVWENMNKNKKFPYEETVLRFIMNTAGQVRKKLPLSITDEMQSFYMAKGLAQLRGKRECGAFEVIDAVRASFVKGEINAQHQPALKNLYKLMTGMEMGCVDSNAGVPPIVNDFLEQCRIFKIQTNTSLKKETKLDVYNNIQHKKKSVFFHQMKYLQTDFCHFLKSQDSNGSTGRILLRESWEYRFAPGVQVALITNSVYGGTLRQACLNLLLKQLSENHNTARTVSEQLLEASYMGLTEIYSDFSQKLTEIIGDDMDFLSVSDCFRNLYKIQEYEQTSGNDIIPYLKDRLDLSVNRLLLLLVTVTQAKKEEEDKICDGIKQLYHYFIDNTANGLEEEFLQSMLSIYKDTSANGALVGISSGILLKKDKISLEEAIEKFQSFLNGSEEAKKLSASFLKGFFRIAKDIVFVDDRLIQSLDSILKETTGNLFLEILPDLRLAFTYFLPFETDKIAKQVSSMYHMSMESLLYEKALPQNEIELAAAVDKFCGEKLSEWLCKKE